MDQNERVSADTLKLYAQRDTLNLYELACLAHDADREQVALGVQAELSTRWREVHGTSRRPTMAESGELTNAMPEIYLGPVIGLTLKALCIATGGTFQRAVPIGQARRLLGALALDLPLELRCPPERPADTGTTKASDAVPPRRPVQRQTAQEEAILAKLRELEFDPLALPGPPRLGALSPAKQPTRAALGFSRDVMDKAWKRLRATRRIVDAKG